MISEAYVDQVVPSNILIFTPTWINYPIWPISFKWVETTNYRLLFPYPRDRQLSYIFVWGVVFLRYILGGPGFWMSISWFHEIIPTGFQGSLIEVATGCHFLKLLVDKLTYIWLANQLLFQQRSKKYTRKKHRDVPWPYVKSSTTDRDMDYSFMMPKTVKGSHRGYFRDAAIPDANPLSSHNAS